MIDIGFEFQLMLEGTYFELSTPFVPHTLNLDLTFKARSLGRFVQHKTFVLKGWIHAEGLARRAEVSGEFIVKTFRNRRFMCDLTFQADDGRLIRFYGEQDLVPIALIDSLTTMNASFYDADGAERGRAEVRLNLSRDWKLIVQSLRPLLERIP
jgi:hypothetical protein